MSAPLAISLGDPAGVGPELICAAWSRREAAGLAPFVVAGGAELLARAAESRGLEVPIRRISSPYEAAKCFAGALPVLGEMDGEYRPGTPCEDGGRLAMQSLELATGLAVSRQACAVVTAPVAKAQLASVGFAFPGQTEYVAHACGIAAEDAVMMLAGPSLKTVPLTVHCALSEIPGRLTQELIVRRCRIVAAALRRDFGIANPRLALAGLNPHAGEEGRMGSEEQQVIAPAIAELQAEGLAVTGPHPGDTMFAAHERTHYDVAVAMYHDQALIPLKTLDFDEGVNMTLGLPIVRTSPDHGTAFGIAGKAKARPGAMLAAIRMASEAALQRAIAS